jgi:hypothetical protein
MATLIVQVHDASHVYRQFITNASMQAGPIDRLGLFGYRTGVLESEVIKPLVLCLLDPEELPIPEAQLVKALDVVESWMVRRMLVRATTKNYNQVVAELVTQVRKTGRADVGGVIESYLAGQSSGSGYWPDDAEIREEIGALLAYRRLGRGRLRMVLEAVEDHLRGWREGKSAIGGERVARGKLAIEHVMPRKWVAHWPVQDPEHGEADRDRNIHTLGNLTLLTGKLNSKVSNGPWLGSDGKRKGLEQHDVLVLNRELLRQAGDHWTDEAIRARTQELAEVIIQIWPVPPNHRSGFSPDRPRLRKKVDLSDLINASVLQPGMPLFPRSKKFMDRVATLLPDGRIEVGDTLFASPSQAAVHIVGHAMNGWWFFLTDQASRTSLRKVRRDYVNAMAVDVEDDEPDDDGDEDEG